MAGKGTLLQPRMITHTRMHQYQQRGRLLFVCWSGKRHKGAQPSTDAQAQAQAQARAQAQAQARGHVFPCQAGASLCMCRPCAMLARATMVTLAGALAFPSVSTISQSIPTNRGLKVELPSGPRVRVASAMVLMSGVGGGGGGLRKTKGVNEDDKGAADGKGAVAGEPRAMVHTCLPSTTTTTFPTISAGHASLYPPHRHTQTHRHTGTQTHTDTHRHTQTHTDKHRHTQTHADTPL